jgi:hypothetical protein
MFAVFFEEMIWVAVMDNFGSAIILKLPKSLCFLLEKVPHSYLIQTLTESHLLDSRPFWDGMTLLIRTCLLQAWQGARASGHSSVCEWFIEKYSSMAQIFETFISLLALVQIIEMHTAQ